VRLETRGVVVRHLVALGKKGCSSVAVGKGIGSKKGRRGPLGTISSKTLWEDSDQENPPRATTKIPLPKAILDSDEKKQFPGGAGGEDRLVFSGKKTPGVVANWTTRPGSKKAISGATENR